jgi:predicted amidohydrolase YtcJ
VELPEHPLVTRGPQKLVLDDDSLPSLADLVELVSTAHDADVPVAVHCVTRTQLVLTVAAFDAAGTRFGDRIEHGSVVPPELIDALARLGVTMITNPSFVYSRGDEYLDEVDDRDVPCLYPCASLLAGGVMVAGGSDAPFGTADPWEAVAAARQRRTRRGRPVGPDEALPLGTAVGLFTGWASAPARQRRLAVGEPADLCFLEEGQVPGLAYSEPVAATIVAGKVVHCIDRSQ